MKKIVICCDGTGNQYGASNSNVVKIYCALQRGPEQIAYYHPGVGTMGARNALTTIGKVWTKIRGLAFGYGLSDNIADAYAFLMREFRPGDEVYIFGFSRGAYTARALTALLRLCGLMTAGNEALIPYALRLFKSSSEDKFLVASGFKKTFSIQCKPHFLGVWDTVSSVGWILDPFGLKPGELPFTRSLPEVSIVRHAVSIDERRAFFRQNLIGKPTPTQDFKEVWFAGVHSDVGGSYAEPESGLAKLALRWMFCEAQAAGLLLDQHSVNELLGESVHCAPPDPTALQHESLHGFWWIGEFWIKRRMLPVGTPVPGQRATYKGHFRMNLGRHREIPPDAQIHQSVFERMQATLAHQRPYRPKNLPQPPLQEKENACELIPRTVHGPTATELPPTPWRKHPIAITALALLAVVGVCAAGVALFTLFHRLDVPDLPRPQEVVWLDQHWTPEQRGQYYHTAQGSELMPYEWFLALEQPRPSFTGAPAFRLNSYMQGFGFIPDGPDARFNPDGLPVGFARDDHFNDPYTNQNQVVLGLTCAACHTGELFYSGKTIRIDAGPAMIDLQKFTEALGLAITWTYYDPLRFHRFADKVLGPNHPKADRVRLRQALKYYLDTSYVEFKSTKHLFPTAEGYGRTDALARIGNFVFGTELNNNKNLVPGTGPVNYPPIWDASWMDWVQYNGSIQQPMGRNVGEALGVRARINLLGYPGAQFENTIRVENLHQIELLLGGAKAGDGVWSPKWPEETLGKIDREKAAKGGQLYQELCVSCHKRPMFSEDGRNPEYWTDYKDHNGFQFFKVKMVDLDFIGTDPNEAKNFNGRTADSGPLGMKTITAQKGLTDITQRVIEQAYDKLALTPAQRDEWNGHRTNELRAPLAYKARPLNGIWATPPYLHNGSVPNLYELLSPVGERSSSFYLGNKEFDPVKLGLNVDKLKGASNLNVSKDGNANTGHEFKDGPKGKGVIGRSLTPDERMQIIEYLKTL